MTDMSTDVSGMKSRLRVPSLVPKSKTNFLFKSTLKFLELFRTQNSAMQGLKF